MAMEPWVLVDASECPGGRDQKRRGVDEKCKSAQTVAERMQFKHTLRGTWAPTGVFEHPT